MNHPKPKCFKCSKVEIPLKSTHNPEKPDGWASPVFRLFEETRRLKRSVLVGANGRL